MVHKIIKVVLRICYFINENNATLNLIKFTFYIFIYSNKTLIVI